MSGDTGSPERPLTRREARGADAPSTAPSSAVPEDDATPVRGVPAVGGVADDGGAAPSAEPLSDAAFPGFDAAAVPPRPPLPAEPGQIEHGGLHADELPASADPLGTADHSAIREQWRAAREELGSHVSQARDQFETHVSHARDQFDQANERIKQRTGRDLIVAILIGVGFGAVLLGSLLFVKWLFVPIALAAAVFGIFELS